MDIPTFNDIFKQLTLNLKLCGIPDDGSSLGFKFYIPFFAMILMMIEEFSFFFSKISADNFLELTALAPCIGIGLLSLAKIFSIGLNRSLIFQLIESLDELYKEILQDVNEKALVGHKIIFVKSLTKYYFILNAILISVYNFSTLLVMLYDYMTKGVVSYTLPYAVMVPFSLDVWQNWLVVYTHSVICGFICVLYYATVDALYCNLTSQVCNHFAIISKELEQLTPANAHTIGEIVKRHQHILNLADILEEIFTASNLYNVLVGSVEICALGFNIMLIVLTGFSTIGKLAYHLGKKLTNATVPMLCLSINIFCYFFPSKAAADWSSMPGFVLFLLSEILQILVMSVFGENILRESTGVGDAALLCEWYNMEHKHKIMILIIVMRSQKPQKLTAYKFSTISYGSFTKIISTSWSYFTILKTVYKPDEKVHIE